MTFLPVVDRELSVAARKRSTYWLRVAAASVALVLGVGMLTLFSVGAVGRSMLGSSLFSALSWLAFAAALATGLFFTSDCLSEEKREGTLGLLFLTDLRGLDVVAGKLLATSLRGFYGLIAVFPIVAVTLLLGGVTGGQFWRSALAVLSALILSLAAGLAGSAACRHSQMALGMTLLLLLLACAAGPAVDGIYALVHHANFKPVASVSSPVFLFWISRSWVPAPFWECLLANQAIAWLLLMAASWILPRTWQDKARRRSASTAQWQYWWKYGSPKRRLACRRQLLPINPVLWLAARERWQGLGLWSMAVAVAGFFAALLALNPGGELWGQWGGIGGIFVLVLYLGTASQACRFFVEARRAGMIELLLTSPLTVAQVLGGQWRALLRTLGLPVMLLLLIQAAGSWYSQRYAWGTLAGKGMASVNVTLLATVSTIGGVLATVVSLAAIAWFGMWMGLTSRNNNLATLKTLVFVQVIPWFVISFGSAMLVSLIMMPRLIKAGMAGSGPAGGGMMLWFPLLSTALSLLMSLAKDIGFIIFARSRLYRCYREEAARVIAPMRYALPAPAASGTLQAPAPSVAAPPPVINSARDP